MSQTDSKATSNEKTYTGTCLCGAVRFEARMDLSRGASQCNCTYCTKFGVTSVGLKPDAFRLVAGAEHLGEFRKEGSLNSRSFCKHCGVQCFGAGYVEELGGAFVSVNINCIDEVDVGQLTIGYWDGRHNNWAAGLRSKPWPVFA
ncbi:GFA family protein [Corallococcus sp. H22C18031201]|uniref:GFA family protein n=1 Tax=Citreicoccus inhibens TaxID=2849499 RepID=UPI000E73EE85|nr:GFA family protein [Citreicoccus inhibens]MBU8896057.1 GFA family protein [Citreicoccus inhibens]RJS25927.1 GFA family protein [Corallococcus sp. H22C18031201]